MSSSPYNTNFYAKHDAWSFNSAKVVVPLVTKLVQPASVVDIGCGNGTWLKAFLEINPGLDVLGVDGDYVDRNQLRIPADKFKPFDLRQELNLNRKFDLVISLEVAEHLTEEYATTYVNSLVKAGDVILFSAAFPGQGGTDHVNEQLPDYWAERFKDHSYQFYDVIRPQILEDHSVERWYRQNIFLVVKDVKARNLNLGEPGLTAVNGKLFERLEFYQRCFEGKGGIQEGFNIFLSSIKNRFRKS